MSMSRKDEARFLTGDEQELVDKSHHPAIGDLDEAGLRDLVKRLRERRDRARDIAARQRREMRGKARPQGADATRDDAGSKAKLAVLAQAMKRANGETARRREKSDRAAMVEGLREALNRKRSQGASRPKSRTAGKGMKAKPSGAREKIADPREAGRVSQFVKQGQARRDSKSG